MLWIGLTGGIATGKSAAAAILREMSIPVIDADVLAHQELQPGSESFQSIVQEFGSRILSQDGTICRQELAMLIFSNENERVKLEAIIHPKVQEKVKHFREKQIFMGTEIAVYDVPLLFEKNLESQFDGVLLIDCEDQIQLDRLMTRNGLSVTEAKLRMAVQMDMNMKRVRATWVIENNSTRDELKIVLQQWLQNLLQSR